MQAYIGEFAALGVAVSWTASSLYFEKAGNNIGALSVNILRIGLAILLLGLATWVLRGRFFPTDAGAEQWIWLSLSGFVGFFLGDLCLFQAYVVIGAPMTQLMMTLAPAFTAFIGFMFLGERMSGLNLLAMSIVIAGILIAMLGRQGRKFKFNISMKGFLFALGGALGQAIGFIMSKKGVMDYDPIAGTQIRAIAGFISFALMLSFMRYWGTIAKHMKSKADMKSVFWGTFFGPFIGVSLSLYAVQHTSAGIAATLIGLVPIFIIFPTVFIQKRRITALQIIGSVVSVGGSVLFFI